MPIEPINMQNLAQLKTAQTPWSELLQMLLL
jgi:hypothetical protein